MRRSFVSLVAVGLVVVAGPSAAEAAPAPRHGDLKPDPPGIVGGFLPVTDGRFAAQFVPAGQPSSQGGIDPDAGQLAVVRDDRTGRPVSPRPECQLTVPQGGYAGEHCADGSWSAVDLRTGARAPIPLASLADDPSGSVAIVGHDWAFWSSPTGRSAYVNWRTGQRRTAPSRDAEPGFAYNRSSGGSLPRLYRRTVVRGIASSASFPQYAARPLKALRLRVGGHTRTIREACEAPGCGGITFQGGVLTWTEGRGGQLVGAYVVRSNRLLDWLAPITGDADGGVDVSHTERKVYVTTLSGPTSAATQVAYEAELPDT